MQRTDAKIEVLYVEDDPTIAWLTRDSLEMKGFEVSHVTDGLEALALFRSRHFDICVVDIMLPRMDGFSLAREIRQLDKSVPILFLSAKSMVDDRIQGLSLGADDYITKPFSVEELVLRMEVFIRRSRSVGMEKSDLIAIGNSVFDPSNQRLTCAENVINLTLRETELLAYLHRNRNSILKREEVLNAVWGNDDYFLGRSLDVFISRLRKMFSGDADVHIETIHGVGFRLTLKE